MAGPERTVAQRIADVKVRIEALEAYRRPGEDFIRGAAEYARLAEQLATETVGRYSPETRIGEAEYWIGRAERAASAVLFRRSQRAAAEAPDNRDLGLVRLRFAMDNYAALKMAGSEDGSDELQRQVDEVLAGARIVVEAERAGRTTTTVTEEIERDADGNATGVRGTVHGHRPAETAEDVWKRLDADVQR